MRVNGAPAVVRWDGLTWRLQAGGAGQSGGRGSRVRERTESDDAPALALIDLAEPRRRCRRRYPLRRAGDDLVMRLGPLRIPAGRPAARVMLIGYSGARP